MTSSDEDPDQSEGMTFVEHLVELRDRLLRVVIAVLVVVLAMFPFANRIYTVLATPLIRMLPPGSSMIATEVASPFLTPFKLVLVLSIFVAMPVALYQVWAFVAPGLYRHERKLIFPLVVMSTFLFYLGMVFAYFVVFPLMFRFFTSVVPAGVTMMTDISKYLDFVLKIFFAFGVAFQVPIATIVLVWTGITTREAMASKRPYVIVGVFVIGAFLTPPDVISQTLLAIPMWGLFELGLILSRMYVKEEAGEAATATAGSGEGASDDPPSEDKSEDKSEEKSKSEDKPDDSAPGS